ncbi:DNA topoisomerase III [Halalkalibacterium halodurans]|uniref:DNA topoisomerase n=1 Tax=Halalkalibacterium halodurans TaxID=86665 RepID=A0A0M0KGE9_ALKHA|nr:DNA topoisomerase III [Halalkalibacterium halodurans]TPE68320.1 DNA topoisomerase III [Halalkalibacterium halodurans]
MGAVVVIAEKPDQGMKLAAPFPHRNKRGYVEVAPCDQFPAGAFFTWAVGHLCELCPPEQYDPSWKKWTLEALPLIPQSFVHRVSRGKKDQFQVIRSLVHRKEVTEIVMAGDAGREGELIVRLILKQCRVKKKTSRLWLSSLTKQAVVSGFHQLKSAESTEPLYHEALSRSCADWLIGMNVTRAYTLLLKKKGVDSLFSTGRVQTPTLALIVKREKEIEAFESKPFWEVKATFRVQGHEYEGIWHKDRETRLFDQPMAEAIAAFCRGKQGKVTKVKKETKTLKPPYLFNLSSLQATANKRFTFSPKKTLDVAQKLYVKGHISYPRTDSSFLTAEEGKAAKRIVQLLKQEDAYASLFPLDRDNLLQDRRYVNQSKVTDHYAIIPTDDVPKVQTLAKDEQLLYDLIVRQFLAAHMREAKIAYTEVETLVDERATFLTKGKQLLDQGWKQIIGLSKHDKDEDIPPLEEGWTGDVKHADVREGKTKPPSRYTEGQLITLMKTVGKHVEDDELEKVLMRTEGLGTEATRAGIITLLKDRQYIEIKKNVVYATEKGKLLIEALGPSLLASPEMTAKWEQRLFEIGRGQADAHAFMEQVKKLSDHLVKEAHQRANTWDFSSFDQEALAEKTKKRKKRGPTYVGSCLACDGKLLDRGEFYGCTNYEAKSCRFTISKTILGKRLSQANVKKLLQGETTNVIKGLKKGSDTFDAKLYWDKEKKKLGFQPVES